MRRYWIPIHLAGVISTFIIIVGSDPFFGDSISTVSRVALNIYDSDFTDLSYPEGRDPGHPILIPLIHAVLWKITGVSLWTSHFFNSLFTIALLLTILKWFKRSEADEYLTFLSWTLILVTPLFLAQTAMLNTHLALTAFVFLAAYAWRFDKRTLFIIASCLAVLTHLQAVFYIIALFLCFALDRLQQSRSKILKADIIDALRWFTPSALIFVLWGIYHYSLEGWAFSSVDYGAHRGFPGFKRFVVNLVLSDWRILDYGQIALVIPAIWIFARTFALRKSYQIWKHPASIFLILYFFNALAISATTTTGPAHRYFLPVLPFLVMASAEAFVRIKLGYRLSLLLVLLSGHFWFYPGKIVGDATLQYRSAIDLLDEVKAEVPGKEVYSFAPLGNPSREMYLKVGVSPLKSLYDQPLNSVSYVLHSNVSGDFSTEELELLRTQWHATSYEKGRIWFNLYANPDSVPDKPEGWQLREPSSAERWMEGLKKKFKGE